MSHPCEIIRHQHFTWVRLPRPGAGDMWADLDQKIAKHRQAKFDTGYRDARKGWRAKTDDDDYMRGFKFGCLILDTPRESAPTPHTLDESRPS